MARPTIEIEKLAAKIADEVRRTPRCEGFMSVSLYELTEDRINGGNWHIATWNMGRADPEPCERVMREVEARLQRQYDVRQ